MEGSTIRAGLASLTGLAVAIAVVAIVEMIGHAAFPPPPGVDVSDPAALEGILDSVHPGAKAMVVVAWFLGSLAGSCVAIRMSGRTVSAWLVGALVAALGLWTSQLFPHPAWMVASAVVLPLVAVLAAKRLMSGKLAA